MSILNKLRLALERKPSSIYEEVLGIRISDPRLYDEAFTHISMRSKANRRDFDNERLEYLGDAVIESVVSHFLFTHFPDRREGFLTETRSKIVRRSTLNATALRLGIDRLLLVQDSIRHNSEDIYGNAFESLIGAIYLDQGYETARSFIHTHFLDTLDLERVANTTVNFKSQLLEWCQPRNLSIDYVCEKRIRPADKRQAFYCTLLVNGHHLSEAWGDTKKQSEQTAARYAMRELFTHTNLQSVVQTPPVPPES